MRAVLPLVLFSLAAGACAAAAGTQDTSARSSASRTTSRPCPSAPEPDGLAAYDSTDLVVPPKVGPGIVYPRTPVARRGAGWRGEVVAHFIVQRDGCVDTASIRFASATDSLYAASVRRALSLSQYSPAIRDGQPVRYRAIHVFSFDVRP